MSILSPALLAASRSDRARSLVTAAPPTRHVVERFVAGETATDAVTAARQLVNDGLQITVDHLGEDTTTAQQAKTVANAYLVLLKMFTEHDLAQHCEVSIKPSALGLAFDPELAYDLAHRIVEAATVAGTTVTVDMEGSATVDDTLEMVQTLRKQTPTVGAVVQAMLHRTEQDCRDLATEGSRVRLVKGAYAEPATIAYADRPAIDAAYERCLETLMRGEGYPMIASHDPRMIESALRLAADTARAGDTWELQMLYGIRAEEQRRLVREGHQVRVYIPYGEDWFGYFMRRLAERPANLTFFLRSFMPRSAR